MCLSRPACQVIYKTYPHVDHRERGVEAVRLLHDVVEVRDLADCRTESINQNQNQIARTCPQAPLATLENATPSLVVPVL